MFNSLFKVVSDSANVGKRDTQKSRMLEFRTLKPSKVLTLHTLKIL